MELGRFAVPSVYALIFFLSYSSQWLLLHLEPYPLEGKQLIRFNVLLVCLLISYTKSVLVDPGHIPNTDEKEISQDEKPIESVGAKFAQPPRKWCRKCNAAKPPRAHHCRECKRCIPKMDHHCPWTQNCVSHTTFPHFLRFLFYAVTSMVYLTTLLSPRLTHLWHHRSFPSYLGPTPLQLSHLFLLTLANTLTLFALTLLLLRNIWCLSINTTTIEGWEIERHKTLLRRARYFGGWLDGPDGSKIHIRKQEFPFDIGIWQNFKQGMGTGNVLAWFWPLSSTPSIASGVAFETNGFEDPGTSWPPPDPDRLQRKRAAVGQGEEAFTFMDRGLSGEEQIAAFKERQQNDEIRRRKPFVERVEARIARPGDEDRDDHGYDSDEDDEREGAGRYPQDGQSGEEAWRNSEGERLHDFGLDEDVEFYDEEDDVPLSEILARKRAKEGIRA